MLNKTFVRFLLAGAVNTLFGFGVFSAAILAGSTVWIALLIGNVAGIAFNFVTTGGYVFRDLSRKRFPRFALAYVLVYVVNLALITLLSNWTANLILAQGLVAMPMALGSYLLMSRFVFRLAPGA